MDSFSFVVGYVVALEIDNIVLWWNRLVPHKIDKKTALWLAPVGVVLGQLTVLLFKFLIK